MRAELVVAAVCFVRDGELLTVRKRGSVRFMLPGGKLEAGEAPEAAARREALEEIGVDAGPLTLLGEYAADAANEPDTTIRSSVFLSDLVLGEVTALAEIEELRWLALASPYPDDLAPLLEHHVLPALAAR